MRGENGLIAENESTAKSAGVKPDDTPHRLRTPKLGERRRKLEEAEGGAEDGGAGLSGIGGPPMSNGGGHDLRHSP